MPAGGTPTRTSKPSWWSLCPQMKTRGSRHRDLDPSHQLKSWSCHQGPACSRPALRFRPGEWLDSWAILVAMHISDKPAEVTYDLSIPLHGYTRKSQLKQLRKPLAGWAKKIAKHRQLAEENLGLVPLPNQPLKRIFFPPGN